MPTVIQIAKNISKGIEGKAFAQIGKTRCKNEDQTKQFLIIPFMNLLGYSYMDLTNDVKYNYTLNIETRDNRYKASINVLNGEIYNSKNPTIHIGKTELNDISESEITRLFLSDIEYFDEKTKYPKSKKKKAQWNEFMYHSKENYRTRPSFVREYLQSALLSLQAKVLESTISDGDDW